MDTVSSPSSEKKRKRDDPAAEELEIDIDAPEPPSKKALRRAKKGKPAQTKQSSSSPPPITDDIAKKEVINGHDGPSGARRAGQDLVTDQNEQQKGEYGVWIGNLPWSADKAGLRTFLIDHGGLSDATITRIHMPAPSKRQEAPGAGVRAKPHNKGFAYVDFASEEAQKQAIGLSETLLGGRALLIKDAQSFAGRPAEHQNDRKDRATNVPRGNPPNKRIFVGNLSFDMDRNMLRDHFAQCGEVEQVFLATFEDTGRCKGYGWVTFADLESAERAVKGLVLYQKDKVRKKGKSGSFDALAFGGHKLRAEFAEEAALRYQKRYGKHGEQSRIVD